MRNLASASAIAVVMHVATTPHAAAQSVVHEVWGSTPSFGFGAAMDVVGDISLDGIPDYIVTNTTAFLTQAPAATIHSGDSGTIVGSVQGPSISVDFGGSVVAGKDLNQDNVPDFIVASKLGTAVGQTKLPYGSIYVYSGATQQPIRQHSNGIAGDFYGQHIFLLDDVTGDAIADYAVHAGYFTQAPDTVDLYSGKTGQWIRQHVAPATNEEYGFAMVSIGDLNGDSASDYGITARLASQTPGSGQPEGAVYIYSGATGAQIATHWGAGTIGFGHGLEALGDVDGDAKPDYVTSDANGFVLVISGQTGAIITQVAAKPNHSFGPLMERAQDIDNDGAEDLLVSEWGPDPGIVALASKSGEILYRYKRPATANQSQATYPRQIASLGDVDQDGMHEWLVAHIQETDPDSGLGGNARVLSLRPLYASSGEGGASGNEAALEINAGVPNATSPYLVLGSVSGTSGIPFGGEIVPLTYDLVTAYTILAYNTVIFENTLGTTNETGNAVAQFDTAYVPSVLQGKTFWFAYILKGPAGYFASNAEPISTSAGPN